MNALSISLIALACTFGGTLLGFRLRRALPEEHLSTASRDLVKLGIGTVATMAALLLGLFAASAKNAYDTESRGVTELSAKVILLDRVLAHYGPDAAGARALLKSAVERVIAQTWHASDIRRGPAEPIESRSEALYDIVQNLVPTNDAQRALQSRALSIAIDIGQTRWMLLMQGYSPASLPLVIVVIFALVITFISFGLHAPPNGTVVATLFLAAVSISGVLYLILEMYLPFGGFISVPSTPLVAALGYLGR